jgi:D-psicose/D-tagatose/L-ribulose 3-epimerase
MARNPIVAHPLIWIGRFTRERAAEAIARAGECGYDGIIVPLRDPAQIDAPAITRACARAGLQPIASIVHPPDADPASADSEIAARGAQRLLDAVALARDIGATQLGGIPHAAWGRASAPPCAVARRDAIAALRAACAAARSAGLRLTMEAVNRFENALVNTADQALALIEEVGADNLLVHLDTHHMLIEEHDPAAAIARCGARLGYLEFSESHRGALGTGNVDVAALLGAARNLGYAGPIGYEAFSAAILDPALAAQLCVWRDTYRDADAVARSARDLIASHLS